jgi:predicted esterase
MLHGARREARRHAWASLRGVRSPVERTNGWQWAEVTGALLLDSRVVWFTMVRASALVLKAIAKEGFKEERATHVGGYSLGAPTTLESSKSHPNYRSVPLTSIRHALGHTAP